MVKKSEAEPPPGYRELSEMQSAPNNQKLELETWKEYVILLAERAI